MALFLASLLVFFMFVVLVFCDLVSVLVSALVLASVFALVLVLCAGDGVWIFVLCWSLFCFVCVCVLLVFR